MKCIAPLAKVSVVAAITACAVIVPAAEGATVGHWRFEEDQFLRNEVTGINLTTHGTAPTQLSLPATGAGSDFSDPIPLTGDANSHAASFGNANGYFTTDLTVGDMSMDAFTIELFFNANDSSGDLQMLVRAWASGGESNQGFWLGISDGRSRANYRGATAVSATDLTVVSGHDYYLAYVRDSLNETWTFYLQDLTEGSPLQQQVFSKTEAFTGADVPVRIGRDEGSPFLGGLIDEVRITNGALSPSQLMVVPEPGSLTLLAAGSVLLMSRRRSTPGLPGMQVPA